MNKYKRALLYLLEGRSPVNLWRLHTARIMNGITIYGEIKIYISNGTFVDRLVS